MDEQNSTLEKTCKKCGERKCVAAFSGHKRAKDGLNGKCRACQKEYDAARHLANPQKRIAAAAAWRAANPEKVKATRTAYLAANAEKTSATQKAWRHANRDKVNAYAATYRAAHPEKVKTLYDLWIAANRDKARGYVAKWRAKNPAKRAAHNAAWRQKNQDKINATRAAWLEANPDARKIMAHNRRARKKANGGVLSGDLAEKLFKLQRGLCACGCGASLKKTGHHIDHRVPIFMGGPNTDENCQLLTPKCNLQKGAKCPIEWAQSKGLLL